MNKTTLWVLVLMMCMSSVLAISGTLLPVYEYEEGNWTATHEGNYTTDAKSLLTYGSCGTPGEDCLVMMNFTLPNAYTNYNTISWLSNVSNNTQINNAEDILAQTDCFGWNGLMVETMIRINNSANPNITYWCSIAADTWLEVGTYAAKWAWVWYSELYWTDAQPTVFLDTTLNGSSKTCAAGTPETVDLLFHVNDTKATNFTCCPLVDSVNLTSYCNYSVSNFTDTVIYNVPLDSGRLNEVMIECSDRSSAAWSDTLYLDVEQCEDCDSMLDGWAKFAMLVLIICIMLTAVLGKEYLSSNKWIFSLMFLLIVCAFALIVLANMVNPCGL